MVGSDHNYGTFANLKLRPELLQAIQDMHYDKPTEIQQLSIPQGMEGHDIVARAATGSGKTEAYLLPLLERLDYEQQQVQAIVLSPTRELAEQVVVRVKKLAAHLPLTMVALVGGKDADPQKNALKKKPHLIVGTPGRLSEMLTEGVFHMGKVKVLVLDEADKLLEMGFSDEIGGVLERLQDDAQTMLFSATMPGDVRKLASQFLQRAVHLSATEGRVPATLVQQYYVVAQDDKLDLLRDLIHTWRPFLSIIFVNTRKRAEAIEYALADLGMDVRLLHGGLSAQKRKSLMASFRKLEFQCLVSTDLTARGLDVEGITHVFNVDLPSDADSYIHRIGRTGRAGGEGVAISLIAPSQKSHLLKLVHATGREAEERIASGTTSKRIRTKGKTLQGNPKDAKGTPVDSDGVGIADRDAAPKKVLTDKEKVAKMGKVKPGYKKKFAEEQRKVKRKAERKQLQDHIYGRKGKRS